MTLAQLSALIKRTQPERFEWWNTLSKPERARNLKQVNAAEAKAKAAAKKAAKQTAKPGKKASVQISGDGSDAFTRQGRMSQKDWNDTFHS